MITLRSLLPEQLEHSNLPMLKTECKAFADRLIHTKLVSSSNKKMTATQEIPEDYSEDLAGAIRNAVMHWISVSNSRGGR